MQFFSISWTPLLALFLLLYSCDNNTTKVQEDISIDLKDPVIQQIFNAQNKRNTQALIPYLRVENPSHRYAAILAFSSVQDTVAIKDISETLLKDDYPEIRAMAAQALGQTRNQKAANFLVQAFSKDSSTLVQKAILENVGKCGNKEHLKHLCTAPPYPRKDTLLYEGQTLGLYNFALRGMTFPEGTDRIISSTNSLCSEQTRFVAANYLARSKEINLKEYEKVLVNAVKEERNTNILMSLVIALAKVKSPQAFNTLKILYAQNQDYRIRSNIIKGLENFSYDSSKVIAFKALNDTSLHTQVCASEYFLRQGKDKDGFVYNNLGQAHPNWQVSSNLYAAALRNLSNAKIQSKNVISQKIMRIYKNSDNLYKKAALLKALGYYRWNYRLLAKELFPTADSIKIPYPIQTAATQGLISCKYLAYSPQVARNNINLELNKLLKRCIESEDPGVIALVADHLRNKKLRYKDVFTDITFLKQAKAKLSLPTNIETALALEQCIRFFENKEKEEGTTIKSSNLIEEIDWPLLNAIQRNRTIRLTTTKGLIELELYPESAPATVTLFVNLIKSGFYNNKVFHRVVPNFVVQSGCPRGDGWGGYHITVNSEFSNLNYDEAGWIGMANAGKDTESTQFFITHSPTIHLNGRYTIFGKVTKGLELVNQLEIGDKIINAELK